jgi:hypothetical protein
MQGLVVGVAPHPVTATVAIKDDGAAAVDVGQMMMLFVKQLNTFVPVSTETRELTAKQRDPIP